MVVVQRKRADLTPTLRRGATGTSDARGGADVRHDMHDGPGPWQRQTAALARAITHGLGRTYVRQSSRTGNLSCTAALFRLQSSVVEPNATVSDSD